MDLTHREAWVVADGSKVRKYESAGRSITVRRFATPRGFEFEVRELGSERKLVILAADGSHWEAVAKAALAYWAAY